MTGPGRSERVEGIRSTTKTPFHLLDMLRYMGSMRGGGGDTIEDKITSIFLRNSRFSLMGFKIIRGVVVFYWYAPSPPPTPKY